MHDKSSICRTVLVCLLTLSLATVGFCARPMSGIVGSGCCKASVVETKVRPCCCPNCDGRCGGACCAKNGSKPSPPPAPSQRGKEHQNPVMVVVEVGSLVGGSKTAGGPGSRGSSFDGAQTVFSLQSQHVRIQT